MNFSNPLINNN